MEGRLENNLEGNQTCYRHMVQQPLILALRSPTPGIALQLLERGADANVVTCESHTGMRSVRTWGLRRLTAHSALDVATEQLQALRRYEEESGSNAPFRPSLPEGIDAYLNNFEEGSYQHYVVSLAIDKRRACYHTQLRVHGKNEPGTANAPGIQEKASAIENAVKTMEKVKEALLAKGAKTFIEMYPEYEDRVDNSVARAHCSLQTDEIETRGPYKFDFSFKGVIDLTEARKEAYLKL